MNEPILYSFRRCPYAMRARLALLVSSMRCQLREVRLSAKPEAMLTASPKGTVPVLVLPDGTVAEQSLDIMHLALARRDPEGWLAREDAALIAVNDGAFKHDLDRYKYPERHDADPARHRARGLEILGELDARLARAPFLGGASRGFTDAAIVPFVRQFAAVDRAWFAGLELAHLRPWLEAYLASPLFAAVMAPIKPWSPEADPVYFPA
ncbi:glutathione S-transferase [Sphingomonas sp. IC081]|uniref:glutathione S-transferase n=1 Tax=Sphingomonas sp. IC081 TaxID=304378 RepID=UPI00115873A0|nr:glutathione S-transferase [Sphingomonas sp. IC081]QDK34794.1 glutathione S-transferase [Sphingomonas sp. IC081]